MEQAGAAMQAVTAFVLDPLQALWARVAAALPAIVGALVLLAIGWVIARLVRTVTTRLAHRLGLDAAVERLGLQAVLARMHVTVPSSALLGGLAGLFVLVAFALSAIDALGLPALSDAVSALMLYLPRVFAALAVLLIGLAVARWCANAVQAAAGATGTELGPLLARVTHGALVFIAALLALAQLDLDVTLVAQLAVITVLAFAAALALSLGLGTRGLAAQLVAGAYARELFAAGDRVVLQDGRGGEVVSIGAVKTVVRLEDGALLTTPNDRLVTDDVTIHRA